MDAGTSSDAAATAIMPGFRFHPTEEELLCYFLKRKVSGKGFPLDVIAEIDIYKCEPSDLTGLSLLKNRDLEWYFFTALDKKYGSGSRMNRTTERGYWKTTGKDRPIQRNARTFGMKKTLVYHIGRAPRGDRTNWVMHEYRLEDAELVEAGILQDAYVVCRVFQKSGCGPKNGEQYGAPFIEEEWDDMVSQKESGNGDSFDAGEQNYIQPVDVEQIPDMGVDNGNAAPVLSPNGPDNFDNSVDPLGFLEGANSQRLLEDRNLLQLQDNQGLYVNAIGNAALPEEHGDKDTFASMDEPGNLPVVNQTSSSFNEQNFFQLHDVNPEEVDCPNDETKDSQAYFGASTANNNPSPIKDDSFFEANDLSNLIKADSAGFEMLDDLLIYLHAIDNKWHYEPVDSSCKQQEKESFTSGLSDLTVEADGGTVESYQVCQQAPNAPDMGGASSSVQNTAENDGSRDENGNFKATNVAVASDVKNEGGWNKSLTKRLTSLLESIPSHPAYAADYFLNGDVKSIKQNPANNSSSIHINAEAFFLSKLTVTDNTKHWSVQEDNDGFLLSYGMRKDGDVMMGSEHLMGNSFGLRPLAETPTKATSVLRSGFYVCFFWVLILAASFKIGNYFYARQ